MALEVIEHGGTKYAEIIWAGTNVEKTTFFSPAESSFQFGLLAHGAGYQEEPHYHKAVRRGRSTTYSRCSSCSAGSSTSSSSPMTTGSSERCDFILVTRSCLFTAVHAIKVIEDFQALSVKQGPFFGDEVDKVLVEPS